jgi:hydrogenase-4 membrane subunit HyfE
VGEERTEGEAMRVGFDYGATIFLVAMQVMLSIAAVLFVFASAFDVSCVGSRCNYGLKGVAIQLMLWSAIVLLFVTLVWIASRRYDNDDATTWFVPATGIAAVAAVALISTALNLAAVDKLPFG